MKSPASDQYITGLGLLRILLCFTVVWDHFGSHTGTGYAALLSMIGTSAVPCFMLLSFYFGEQAFAQKNHRKLLDRIKGLLAVHLFWTGIYAIYGWLTARNGLMREIIYQFFFGATLNPPMWFHVALIVLTVCFWLIYAVSGNLRHAILIFLTVATFFLQYAGLYRSGIQMLNVTEAHTTVGRIVEMIPYACIGLAAAEAKIYDRIKTHWMMYLLLSVSALLFLAVFDVFILPDGYGYQGLSHLCKAVFIVTACASLPEKLFPAKVKDMVRRCADCTLQVYCMHYLVGILLLRAGVMAEGGLMMTVIVFFICFTISWLYQSLFEKNSGKQR